MKFKKNNEYKKYGLTNFLLGKLTQLQVSRDKRGKVIIVRFESWIWRTRNNKEGKVTPKFLLSESGRVEGSQCD